MTNPDAIGVLNNAIQNISRVIKALENTEKASTAYAAGATFNLLCAKNLVVHAMNPAFKELLQANPMLLFTTWKQLGMEPFNINDRTRRSNVLEHALWVDYIESDSYYPCLCTDGYGVVKDGYWKTWRYLADCFEDPKWKNPTTIQEAESILRTHRVELFSKFFPDDTVDFIMQTIPCTTIID